MLSTFTASPVHRLLVGVPSYGAPVAFARRQHIRSLSDARSNATLGSLGGAGAQQPDPVSLVFVLPYDTHAVAEDATWADVWRVRLPAGRRARHNYGLEKWLLCNAFLRRAVAEHPAFDFYAIADDDTLFNVTTLHARLRPFAPHNFSPDGSPLTATAAAPPLVFGSIEEWFMWDPDAMISACFAYSSRRWEVAHRMLAAAGGENFTAALARKHRECVQPRHVGPFPYVKGHLLGSMSKTRPAWLGYSASAARLLVSLFDCCGDEDYALTTRRTTAFQHSYLDRLIAPSSRQHPANNPLVEDVYYMHLLFKALRNGSLTLLHLRLSEFVVERGARAVSHADVYHKLKRPDRFEWIRARPQLLSPREGVEDPQSARPRCEPLRRRYKRATKVEHCCETWTWCDYLSNS